MQCPYCLRESKAKVVESRRLEGNIWRRRMCDKCLKLFTTKEVHIESRMPNRNRPNKLVSPKEDVKVFNSGAHLQSIWK